MPLAKNDIITLEITALTNEGSGVGHYKEDSSDGRGIAVFVPLTAVGDVISCRVVKVLRSYAYGRVEGILTASPDRAEDGCPVYAKCGGCCFRHISYEAELRAKQGFVQDAFMNDYFRVYTSGDIVGVELAAALKNVIALSCGICAGMGFQDNTRALLMTRAMAEITRLGEKLGGTRLTFGGLAGMGDLIVTCTSMHSRNNRAGILIGQGKSVQAAMEEVGAVVEGYYAVDAARALAQKVGVEMPITEAAYEVLYQGRDPKEAILTLMRREKRHEIEETWG